jgi:hypothetical protein
MNWIKISFLNILLTLALFLLAEIGFRVTYTLKSCFSDSCNFALLKSVMQKESFLNYLGLTTLDRDLGYVPTPGFSTNIQARGWDNIKVSINSDGFRDNGKTLSKSSDMILAVGDSFTFGDQVSNSDTWVSCLQDKLHVRVNNGGVFGYGVGQSVQRAKIETKKSKYQGIILSILIDHDLKRDQMSYRDGFPKPYFKNSFGAVKRILNNNPYRLGTKHNPKNNPLIENFQNASALYKYLSNKISFLPKGMNSYNLSILEKDSASLLNIAKYVLGEFRDLDIQNKYIVFQYNRDYNPASKEKMLFSSILKEMPEIIVIDTLPNLKTYEPSQIWSGHHTKYGNNIVCNTIYNTMKNTIE